MNSKPNPDDFSKDEKTGLYDVEIAIEGSVTKRVKASSQDEADAIAEAMADRIAEGVDDADLDQVDDIRISSCRPARPLFRVMRKGRPMQVSHLEPGDIPREPDERGF